MANCFCLDEQPDESASANPEAPGVNVDGPIYGIPWQANRLTYGQLRTLRQISKDVRLPITQLLKDAVDVYLAVLQREIQAAMVAEQEANREPGEPEAANNEETATVPERPADDRATGEPDENSPTGRMPLMPHPLGLAPKKRPISHDLTARVVTWYTLTTRIVFSRSPPELEIMSDPMAPLGSTEIAILRYLDQRAPLSVGDVAEYFAETTGQARTTILTIMERLRKKGYLTRRQIKGVFRYSPKVSQKALLQKLVQRFVDTTLAGSVSPFVAYLSEGGPVSELDLQQLKQLVEDLEQLRKRGGT